MPIQKVKALDQIMKISQKKKKQKMFMSKMGRPNLVINFYCAQQFLKTDFTYTYLPPTASITEVKIQLWISNIGHQLKTIHCFA